jgi:hypothetical protein
VTADNVVVKASFPRTFPGSEFEAGTRKCPHFLGQMKTVESARERPQIGRRVEDDLGRNRERKKQVTILTWRGRTITRVTQKNTNPSSHNGSKVDLESTMLYFDPEENRWTNRKTSIGPPGEGQVSPKFVCGVQFGRKVLNERSGGKYSQFSALVSYCLEG